MKTKTHKNKTLVYFTGLDPNGTKQGLESKGRSHASPLPPHFPSPQVLLLTFHFFSLVLFQLAS